jgi:hypothetical protein
METAKFEELQRLLESAGPMAALERLSSQLRESKDFEGLFYARLLAARHRLGASPIPTGPISDIPEENQEEYENAIRAACREVGQLFLREGNLGQAYGYYRMIGETGPVKQALADHTPGEDEDFDTLVRLALYEGLLPKKGYDWVLQRFGLCSAITTLGGQQLPMSAEERRYCVGRVVRTLHEELRERLAADIERHEGKLPAEASAPRETVGVIRKMMAGRDWLFGDDCYHVDLSHLSSAVQMSLDLEPGEELQMARELCAYGQRLSGAFKNPSDPPFDEPYRDQDIYLGILAGENVEGGLAHFRAKAELGTEEVGTGPAEVLVQLLQRLGRTDEALEVARKYLARADSTWLPFLTDLCRRANNYRMLADAAREQGNTVQFLAGLLASRAT